MVFRGTDQDRIGALESRKTELTGLLANAEEPPSLLHPSISEVYRQRISALYDRLQDEDERTEAIAVFRTLVDRVLLHPGENEAVHRAAGRFGGDSGVCTGKKKPDLVSEAGLLAGLISPGSLAAGTGFEPVTFRL